MPKVETIADFWDYEFEHCERAAVRINPDIYHAISKKLGKNRLNKYDVADEMRKMAEAQAIEVKWEIGDKVLTFPDGSQLGIVAPGAGTAAGWSRVMRPGEVGVRDRVRDGALYRHGTTRSAWYWTRNGNINGADDTPYRGLEGWALFSPRPPEAPELITTSDQFPASIIEDMRDYATSLIADNPAPAHLALVLVTAEMLSGTDE